MTLVAFGEFADGKSDFASDFGGFAEGWCKILTGGQGGGYFLRVTANGADAGTTSGSGPGAIKLIRHWAGLGFKGGTLDLNPGATVWRTIAMRIPSEQSNQDQGWLGVDEYHQDAGGCPNHWSGIAPLNHGFRGVGSTWEHVFTGGNSPGCTDSQGLQVGAWSQIHVGVDSAGDWPCYPYVGGNKTVIRDEWVTWVTGWHMGYKGAPGGNGWVEIWARWPSLSDWRNVLPRLECETSFANTNYPQVGGVYANIPAAAWGDANYKVAIDLCHGEWGTDFEEILNWANEANGFGGTPPPPPPPPPTQTIESSISAGETLEGTVQWIATTSGATTVEFWADNSRLAEVVLGSDGKATFPLDTVKMANGKHALGFGVTWDDGTRTTPQVGEVTVANATPPPTDPLNLRILSQSATVITLGWDVRPDQEGYVAMLDGSELLTDGKRHASVSQTANSLRIGKPRDGKQHAYGVKILGGVREGSVTA